VKRRVEFVNLEFDTQTKEVKLNFTYHGKKKRIAYEFILTFFDIRVLRGAIEKMFRKLSDTAIPEPPVEVLETLKDQGFLEFPKEEVETWLPFLLDLHFMEIVDTPRIIGGSVGAVLQRGKDEHLDALMRLLRR